MISLGDIPKTQIWARLGLYRPLEADQTDNGGSESYVWHIGAGWKRPTGPGVINHDDIILETSRKH